MGDALIFSQERLTSGSGLEESGSAPTWMMQKECNGQREI